MYLACHRRDIVREWLYVGREQFLDATIFQYLVDYRMLVGKRAQCVLICWVTVAYARLRLYLRIKLELFE